MQIECNLRRKAGKALDYNDVLGVLAKIQAGVIKLNKRTDDDQDKENSAMVTDAFMHNTILHFLADGYVTSANFIACIFVMLALNKNIQV